MIYHPPQKILPIISYLEEVAITSVISEGITQSFKLLSPYYILSSCFTIYGKYVLEARFNFLILKFIWIIFKHSILKEIFIFSLLFSIHFYLTSWFTVFSITKSLP
jgi:hypothetical protein